MAELHLYQYEDHDLIQLTDGRPPSSDAEHEKGWRLLKRMPATIEAIGEVSARAAGEVLREISERGCCSLSTWREIAPAWWAANTAEGRKGA